ncbi:MAG: pilus assembly protein [Anaerolineae bacterium]|nr:pilus assembly protein [Caldilineales bacterium]MDW8267603.1 pilus assembly protein [Anaerolineae bacterium]
MPRQQGQSVLEYALILFILLVLTFGLIDLGRAVFTAGVVRAAAQAGARAGIVVGATSAQIEQAARNRMVGINPSLASITVTRPRSDMIEVTVRYQFRFVTPLIGTLIGRDLSLQATAAMISH